MAVYTGRGLVWNPNKNKILCDLNKGPYTTLDKAEQEILASVGYIGDFEDELVIIEDEEDETIDDMGVRELKAYCKDKGYEGYSNLNKVELLELINLKEGD